MASLGRSVNVRYRRRSGHYTLGNFLGDRYLTLMKNIAVILILASFSILAHADQQPGDETVRMSRNCAIAIIATIEDLADRSENPLVSTYGQLDCIESADKIVVHVLPKSVLSRGGGWTYELHPQSKEIIAKIPQR